MREIIENYTDVIAGVSMVIAMTVMYGYAVTAYRDILFNVIRACLG